MPGRWVMLLLLQLATKVVTTAAAAAAAAAAAVDTDHDHMAIILQDKCSLYYNTPYRPRLIFCEIANCAFKLHFTVCALLYAYALPYLFIPFAR
jgi:hypothetical protein